MSEFDFWNGGKDTVRYLTSEQLDIIEGIRPNGISDTALNDLMWFDDELIADWLGYADFDELMNDSVPFEV